MTSGVKRCPRQLVLTSAHRTAPWEQKLTLPYITEGKILNKSVKKGIPSKLVFLFVICN